MTFSLIFLAIMCISWSYGIFLQWNHYFIFSQVLTNVVGALAECAKLAHNRDVIRKVQGIPPLVNLLNLTNQPLLENTTRVLGECAWDSECMAEIEEMDGVRLIWSLLKNDSPKVQAEAAWALVPCVQNAKVINVLLVYMIVFNVFSYEAGC